MRDFVGGRWGQGLLLEYVFLEVVTVLAARRTLDVATAVGRVLLEARELEFVACSDVFAETWDRFTNQSGGDLSFADCAIATVALRQDPPLVATFDRDFATIPGLTVVP